MCFVSAAIKNHNNIGKSNKRKEKTMKLTFFSLYSGIMIQIMLSIIFRILNIKPTNLPHKTRPVVVNSISKACVKEDRKDDVSVSMKKPKLKLTRPKQPEFGTSQRERPTRVKSSAELEEELMAKMPVFKARPVNKKILETPPFQARPKSTPQLPEFKEYHLETMRRAGQNHETATVTESPAQSRKLNPHHLTAPKPPVLQRSLRARPSTVKSSVELEKKELEKIPKFKAKPLNKKSRNCNPHHHGINIPKLTNPKPFSLLTEERGAEKERKRAVEILQKQMEEERSRIPIAAPYPYTTDFQEIPKKPEPKPSTKPEPFQLESLMRHEEEMKRKIEERQRLEREKVKQGIFKAQPVLKEDPIPLPEKERRPLTKVQEFDLQVQNRAVDRAKFDKKIKEKEMMYKKYREEAESARMMEEAKAVKQLRRMMVHHARPVPKFHHPILPQRNWKMGDGEENGGFLIDPQCEFSAPQFYDFNIVETQSDMEKTELWFDINSAYAPSHLTKQQNRSHQSCTLLEEEDDERCPVL